MKAELVRKLKEIPDIIYKDPDGKPIESKAGLALDYYVDIKKAYGYHEVLDLISHYIFTHIPGGTTCIAAAGYGGLPPAAVIATEYNLKLTMIRDKPKQHGKGGLIDGYVPTPADKVAVIDDVFTTGKNMRIVTEVLKPTGAQILGYVVVVKRSEGNMEGLDYLLEPRDLL
jgi:orotate phosphoribosyltransferase